MTKELSRNRAASALVSLAVKKLFPFSKTLSLTSDQNGFLGKYFLSTSFLPEHRNLLEEECKRLIKKNLMISHREMVPASAEGLFLNLGETHLAEEAKNSHGLLSFAEIEGFYAFLSPPFFPETGEIGSLCLSFSCNDNEVTITGRGFADHESVKKYRKKLKEAAKHSYLPLGKKFELFEEENEKIVFRQRGIRLEEVIISLWREGLRALELEQCSDFEIKNCRSGAIWQPFYDPPFSHSTKDHLTLFLKEGEVVSQTISLLQLMIKILKLFSFDWVIYLTPNRKDSEPEKKETAILKKVLDELQLEYSLAEQKGNTARIEFRVRDFLENEWELSSVELIKNREDLHIEASLIGSLHRFLALAIEQGEFPLWLIPEQLYILLADHSARGYALDLAKDLEVRGIRVGTDLTDRKLDEKLRLAKKKGAFYLLVVGKKEMKSQALTVSRRRGEDLLNLTVEEIANHINEQVLGGL